MPFLVPEIFKLGRLIAKRIPFLVEITLKRFFSFLVYIYIKLIKVDVTNYIYISETSLGKFQISSQSSMASEPENPFEIVRSFVRFQSRDDNTSATIDARAVSNYRLARGAEIFKGGWYCSVPLCAVLDIREMAGEENQPTKILQREREREIVIPIFRSDLSAVGKSTIFHGKKVGREEKRGDHFKYCAVPFLLLPLPRFFVFAF